MASHACGSDPVYSTDVRDGEFTVNWVGPTALGEAKECEELDG